MPDPDAFILKLYITRQTASVTRAIAMLEDICESELDGRCSLEVINISDRPDVAEKQRIIATPVLIKELPPPLRRVIGDLIDREKVLQGIDLNYMNRRVP